MRLCTRLFCVALIAAILTTSMASQTPADFAGRWRIVTSPTPSGAATDLLFTGPTPTQMILIARGFETGVVFEPYTTDVDRRSMALEARWTGGDLLLAKPGNDGRGAAPRTPDREERWSIGADGALHVAVTERIRGMAATTMLLVYRRVPLPEGRPGENLLDNPAADHSGRGWLAIGDARIEACDGNPCFVVRNKGSFHQTVLLPLDAAGKYLVMIGAGSSERINTDRAITGLPYLYGMVAIADGSRYLSYLQGMLAETRTPNAWVTMAGVFPVPNGAARVSFQLNQAERRGVPQNGSAAKFDDLGCYLFPTDAAARAFVAGWRARHGAPSVPFGS